MTMYAAYASVHTRMECACGRWTHEDCVEDCVMDVDGKERFCPVCLV